MDNKPTRRVVTMPLFQQIETIHPPTLYGPTQIQQAYVIALAMNRGVLVLTEPPA